MSIMNTSTNTLTPQLLDQINAYWRVVKRAIDHHRLAAFRARCRTAIWDSTSAFLPWGRNRLIRMICLRGLAPGSGQAGGQGGLPQSDQFEAVRMMGRSLYYK
jgi:hypothetical protein